MVWYIISFGVLPCDHCLLVSRHHLIGVVTLTLDSEVLLAGARGFFPSALGGFSTLNLVSSVV